jgi:hypothetical protein
MPGREVRSLNLATAAGIALYEALRQLGRDEAAERARASESPAGSAPRRRSARPASRRRSR